MTDNEYFYAYDIPRLAMSYILLINIIVIVYIVNNVNSYIQAPKNVL